MANISNREVIYKYPLIQTDGFEIEMPKGARILTVQVQDGEPYIWAIVNPDNDTEVRGFRLAGTGHQLNTMGFTDMVYIGTFQLYDGGLVFHLFEIKY